MKSQRLLQRSTCLPPACRTDRAGRGVKMNNKWYAYVLLCDDGSLYKGHTDNLTRRYEQHLNGQGSVHTKRHKPLRIIYYEEFDSQTQAIAREKYFKSGAGRSWLKANLNGSDCEQ